MTTTTGDGGAGSGPGGGGGTGPKVLIWLGSVIAYGITVAVIETARRWPRWSR